MKGKITYKELLTRASLFLVLLSLSSASLLSLDTHVQDYHTVEIEVVESEEERKTDEFSLDSADENEIVFHFIFLIDYVNSDKVVSSQVIPPVNYMDTHYPPPEL